VPLDLSVKAERGRDVTVESMVGGAGLHPKKRWVAEHGKRVMVF
jgi:hypothetical protein